MSIERLLELARAQLTPQQRDEMRLRQLASQREFEQEIIERHRCSECGVDTLNYSHAFRCYWRGLS